MSLSESSGGEKTWQHDGKRSTDRVLEDIFIDAILEQRGHLGKPG